MHVFGSSPGQVAVFRSPEAVGMTLTVEGLTTRDGTLPALRAVVTAVGLNEAVNAQFSPTLGQLTYVYVFGDRPATMEVTGVHFANPCDEGASGFELLHGYWRKARASARRTAVGATFGTRVGVRGFLTECNLQTPAPDTGFGQFRLGFVYSPAS